MHVATLLAARAAGFRLLLRGLGSQISITAVAALLGSLVLLVLMRVFRPDAQYQDASTRYVVAALVTSSLATGASAPVVLWLVHRIDARSRRDESASLT